MPSRKNNKNSSHAEEPFSLAAGAIRDWWNIYQGNQLNTSDSNTEENKKELGGKKLLSLNLNQTLRTRQLLIDFDAGRPVLSLRAPLDLVNFQTTSRPRWPIECEVVTDTICHIEWDPTEPEPLYQFTGHERTPFTSVEDKGKVVYCTEHANRFPYFTCSRVGGSRGPIKQATYDTNRTEFTLDFESRFESGNLHKAVQVGVHEYELTLQTDMYTQKHTQWFYFRVRNMKAGVAYRFTITNLMKRGSLYSQGMRPLLYSERAAQEKGIGWQHTGSNIRYYRNSNRAAKDNNSDAAALYALTWTLQFPYDSDTCYLAHCYPYTYSQLQRYLRNISSNPAVVSYCTVRVLCHSLAGNAVYVLTITSRGMSRPERRTKKAVVVTARVHPGETNGSWMMEGFLDFLLGDSEDAQLLRDTFVFKVVPMLNPDGVIVGNYRCSLAGRDLNRNYQTSLRDSFPCVWHARSMVERLLAGTDVVLYCDFHGHSRKNNVFMYGCNTAGDAALKLRERVFPLMMSKNASNKFSFKSCKFRVQKSKEGTGRVTMWKLGIKNSYTMEASFGGSTLGDRKGTHFTTGDLKSIGYCFCDTLLDYCDPDPSKVTYCLSELAVLLGKEARERLGKDVGTEHNFTVSDLETSTSGSNSSESDGLPAHLLQQPKPAHQTENPVKKKKKRLRSLKERNKLRQQRLRSSATLTALQNNDSHNQESYMTDENTVQEGEQEGRTAGRHRKKWRVKGLVRKAVIPPPTTHLVEDTSLDGRPARRQPCRAKASSHLRPHTAVAPHIDGPGVYTGQWRCSTQLLHLSALLAPPPAVVQCNQQRLLPSLTGHHRFHSPMHVKMLDMPDNVATKHLLSGFADDKFNNRLQTLKNRHSLRVTEEEEESSAGLSLLRRFPFGQQNQTDHSSAAVSHNSLFLPVSRGRVLRANRLQKELPVPKNYTGLSSPLTGPSDLVRLQVQHSHKDTPVRLQDDFFRLYHSRRNVKITSAPNKGTRVSQSAPLLRSNDNLGITD
ncbi:cytosolic carboxypeptidase 2 isoform X2 [Nelusetta ayraudi]|uniref:cytosolic carboxypeptidase 2 isoform X2 n=1 Tax=Nelusetta ayraudi TaxID=303726 RepID=UPI003F7268CD